jgi:signal transduction histidine kinase/DNA-binding NarL/FixJ family response regulator
MKLKNIFKILFLTNLLALFGVMFIIDQYQKATNNLENAYKLQHKSFLLADELRQSSDDLTRMARTYVVTGNTMFEKQFQTVLDIRNGIIPRPQNYNRIYWDFLTLNGAKATLDGDKKPLRELMKQVGFSESELGLLFQSAKESDDLTKLETKAMNAVKGIFQDENGGYTIYDRPNLQLATEIMHSDEYHRAKIAIMKPLDEFYQSFEKRTKQNVQNAHEKVKLLEHLVTFAIVALIFLVLLSFFILLSRIVYPLEALTFSMVELSQNNMDINLPYRKLNDEVGAMIETVKIFKENAIRLIQKEEKLQLAIQEARAANNSKSTFLANMSHELRSPLNAILGFSTLLKKSKNLSSSEQEYVTLIDSSGKHLLTIINEILELSKIEVGKIEIKENDFDLHFMLNEINLMFKQRCENKGLIFSFRVDDNIPRYIKLDEKRLKQILINLIGNALKFTQLGSIIIDVKINKSIIFFEVSDTGVGIKKENQKKIFKPFEQLESNKMTARGTGLGLSITKELIGLMGGEIKVKSEVGIGSVFSFYIPFKKAKQKVQENIHKNKTITFTGDFSVIVADDMKQNRIYLVELLKTYGIDSYEANDGKETIELLQNNKVDMVFLDLLMPNMNGYEVLEELQKNRNFQDIPVVVVSANVFDEDKQKALQLGAKDFITKPIDENHIIDVCNRLLQKKEYVNTEKFNLEKQFLKELQTFAKNLDGENIKTILEKNEIDESLKIRIIEAVDNFDFEKILKMSV